MAGVAQGNNYNFAIIFFALFIAIFTPLAKASSDGLVIDDSTINLGDFASFDADYIEFGFTVVAIGTTTDGSFSGNLYYETKAISGEVITNNSISIEVGEGESLPVNLNVSQLEFGFTIIAVGLVGDIASNSSGFTAHFERTIQRLSPLNISIAPTASIISESIDNNQELTGNNSLSDGDFLQLQIPIINNGDYNWTGGININLTIDDSYESFESSNFTVNKRQTAIIFYNSTNQMIEGSVLVAIELNGTSDNYLVDNEINFQVPVNPPPLPLIDLVIDINQEKLVAGDTLQINVTVNNNGTVDYLGKLFCYQDLTLIFQSNLTVNSSSSYFNQFSTNVKPSQINCQSVGSRVDEQSNNFSSIDIIVEAAFFESAGTNSPSSMNGPWHIGDDVEFSMLLINSGDKSGNVSLLIESLGIFYEGDSISLQPNQAGQISIIVPVQTSKNQIFNWSINSLDGDYHADLVGSISVPVADRQLLNYNFTDVSWDFENGIKVSWMIELSAGLSRDVNLKIGYTYLSDESIIVDANLGLEPGQTSGELIIGLVEADNVLMRVQELNWTADSSFSLYTESIPKERPSYRVYFDNQSNPNRPRVGELASVSVTISNDGDAGGGSGELLLYDQNDVILSQQNTPKLGPGELRTITFNVIWPAGDEIILHCRWNYLDSSETINRQFLSTPEVQAKDSLAIPWSGIFGGFAVASMVILVIRIRGTKSRTITNIDTDGVSLGNLTESNVEKIEIGCPECSRQLRVPKEYSGVVKCPDCSTSFDPSSLDDRAIEERDEDVEKIPNDGKIEISCPDCSQNLRIPQSYSGSVRCPSCKVVFATKN